MTGWLIFLVSFVSAFISAVLTLIWWEHRMLKECHGSIIMYGDEVYLSLTKEDIDAFEHARFATLRLQREKFKGFNGT